MAEPLKTFFSPALVRRLAADLERADPSFPSKAFVRRATTGLESLELMERGKLIASALAEHLSHEYPKAIAVLLRSLGPEHASDELVGAGMAPFFYLPHTLFVGAQYELTKRFSAEGSIRQFIAKDPERTFAALHAWTKDENAHVRRLVSEGTRLRLPWAVRVPWLDANPERVLELLELLKDDRTALVRRSVANNLNDLGKVHSTLVTATCKRWARGASAERQALIRHALRSLVKKGDRDALALLGAGATPEIEITSVRTSPRSVRRGGQVSFSFQLRSSSSGAQQLVVDYAVHFVKANGAPRPKVFKLKRITLGGGECAELGGKISLAEMTTRRHYPGLHRIELLVNGVAFPLAAFEVLD